MWSNSRITPFLGFASLSSLAIFLATTIPTKSGIMFTDRKRFQRLLQNGVTRDAEYALMNVLTQVLLEKSYRNVNLTQTTIIEKDPEPMMKFWAHYVRYQYHKELSEKSNMEPYREILYSFKDVFPPQLWKTLQIVKERLFFTIRESFNPWQKSFSCALYTLP
jgi:hypothetical protein